MAVGVCSVTVTTVLISLFVVCCVCVALCCCVMCVFISFVGCSKFGGVTYLFSTLVCCAVCRLLSRLADSVTLCLLCSC